MARSGGRGPRYADGQFLYRLEARSTWLGRSTELVSKLDRLEEVFGGGLGAKGLQIVIAPGDGSVGHAGLVCGLGVVSCITDVDRFPGRNPADAEDSAELELTMPGTIPACESCWSDELMPSKSENSRRCSAMTLRMLVTSAGSRHRGILARFIISCMER